MTDSRLRDYIDHMAEAAELAIGFVQGTNREGFLEDKRTQQAVIFNLIVIGEAATKVVNQYAAFAERQKAIPWTSMKGMRNRIVHGYFDIDLDIDWETVRTNLPDLLNALADIKASFP